MNKEERFEHEILRKYINSDSIEKAPEGFTSKTMTRIRIEAESPVMTVRAYLNRYRVPLVSTVITAALLAALIFIPAGQSGTISQLVLKYIGNSGISLPKIDFSAMPSLNMPGWFSYAVIGIILLAFFDRALSGLFRRHRV